MNSVMKLSTILLEQPTSFKLVLAVNNNDIQLHTMIISEVIEYKNSNVLEQVRIDDMIPISHNEILRESSSHVHDELIEYNNSTNTTIAFYKDTNKPNTYYRLIIY